MTMLLLMGSKHRSGCDIAGCEKKHKSGGLCGMHYQRTLRNPKVPRSAPVDERFDEKWRLDPVTGCWLWWGGKTGGYGIFWDGARYVKAHRYAYERKYGPIPEGLYMDHFACDNRGCCCPDHVRPVTPRENSLRGNEGVTAQNLAKTHCKRGHPFDEVNTYWMKDGGRSCRTCQRMHTLAHYHRTKAR